MATSGSGSIGPGASLQGTNATSSGTAQSGVMLTPQGTETYATGGSTNQSVSGSYSFGFGGGVTNGGAAGDYSSGATGNVGSIGFGGWSW